MDTQMVAVHFDLQDVMARPQVQSVFGWCATVEAQKVAVKLSVSVRQC